MGQQQLLLIILGVIIVGIAVVVGITMFQDNAVDQNRTAVIGDLTTLAAKAQQYYAKPSSLSGGQNTFTGLTIDVLASPAFATNANGKYTVTSVAAQSVVLHGVGVTTIDGGANFPEYDMTVTAHDQTPNKVK